MPPTAAESSPNQTPLWRPSGERIARANITRFIECINARRGLSLRDYASLYEWSIGEPAAFWSELARFTDTRARWGNAPVIQDSARPPRARWFADTELNFAQNLLRYRDGEPALVFVDERGTRRELCYRELYAQVARVAHGLRDLGVTRGDRVAAYMPNLPETIIAMLAATSLGAIWCSCALEHGAQLAIERFGPLAPKVLFTADGYPFAGERHERLGQVATALAHLPSVEHVIVTGYLDARPEISALRGARDFATFGIACAEIEFVATPFDHPVYIVFASAAGGPPQGIVHGAGGTLLQHQKEQVLHTDLKRSDRLCCGTHCDWITWNWLASALATGATLVLYEGSPFHPGPAALWRLAESERVTIFGASAEYFDRLARCGFCPRGSVELAPLKTIFSTGSPLAPQQYDFIYQCVKPDVQLASVAAGADILCCVCLGNPVLPVYRGEVQSRGLGMRVEIVDHGNRRVRGERGELVCSALIPSMPVGLWDDADGARYRATFFERYPDGWLHRDRAMLTEHDGIVILGHSA